VPVSLKGVPTSHVLLNSYIVLFFFQQTCGESQTAIATTIVLWALTIIDLLGRGEKST
jgi:hypothetical protein